MPSEELQQAEILKNEGKFNEAQKELNKIEEKGGLSSSELLYLHLLKGSVLYIIGKFSEAIDSSELAYQKSQELMKTLQSIDALIIKGNALTRSGDTKNAMEMIVQGEELLKAVKVEDPIEITKRKGSIAISKGLNYFFLSNPKASLNNLLLGLKLHEEIGDKNEIAMSLLLIGMAYATLGNFEEALNYAERCQQMTDEITDKTIIAYNFVHLGGIAAMRGELDQSMDDYKQAIEILEEFNHIQAIGVCLSNIGEVYRYKGNFRKALKYYEEGVLLIEKTGNIYFLVSLLVDLCLLALDIGDTKLAQDYLGRIQEFSEQSESKRIKGLHNLCKALILKTSSRASNRAESEEILKKIVNEEMVNFELTTLALFNLCDLLLFELKLTNDTDMVEEVNKFISQLLSISENQKSYFLLAETYTLKAELALLTLDIKNARRFLTQAQQIAERFGLNKLAADISLKHKKLVEQLATWENLKEIVISITERMRLARLDTDMKEMLQKDTILHAQISDEEVAIHRERKVCLVCRGEVLGYMYICKCDTIYCENCARALTNLENACWVCNAPLDLSKPINPYEEEKITGKRDIKDLLKKSKK